MRVDRLRVNISFKKNLIFALTVLLFLLQAYLHDKNIVYLFIFFVISIVIINNIFLKRNLKNLEIELLALKEPFAKEESMVIFSIKNPTDNDKFDIWLNNRVNFSIQAHSSTTLYLKKVFPKRGELKSIEIELSSTFPLNMFDRYYTILRFDGEFIIYPQRIGVSLQNSFGTKKELFGIRDDFKGLREYQEGDRASLIDWKSLSKGELKSKEFEHLSSFDGYIFDIEKIDGDLEERLSQLTLWVVEAFESDLDFCLKLKDTELNSKRDTKEDILTKLALYQEDS